MIRVALVGLGNVGRRVLDALGDAKDMKLVCVCEAPNVPAASGLEALWVTDVGDIRAHGEVDVAILALPSRACPHVAETLLSMGIRTADGYDIHTEIWDTKVRLQEAAQKHGTAAVIAAGWDPGTDSVVRALLEAMAPKGLSYTNFGPGMSMGHTVAAKSVPGVANALSMTIPAGSGVHRRMVYVQLENGAKLEAVAAAVKADPYFAHDETHVVAVDDVGALLNMGHGVVLERYGVSGQAHNQTFSYSMKINNPALTGQILVCAARAAMRCLPGCYTLIELPVIDLLPGEREDLVKRLV